MLSILSNSDEVEIYDGEIVPGDNFQILTLPEIVPVNAPPPSRHAPSVYISGLPSQNSKRTMRAAIRHIADIVAELSGNPACNAMTLPWGELRYEHTAAILAELIDSGAAPATIKHKVSALKGVLKAAWRLGQISYEDFHRATDLATVKGSTVLAGRLVNQGEIRTLIDACTADPTPLGARDTAILGCLFGAGLRRAEVVGLDVADFTEEAGALRVRHGKGNKQRINYVKGGALDAIGYWLEKRGEDPGPLFLPMNRSGNFVRKGSQILMRRLDSQAVMDMLLKRSLQAGIKRLSPHDARRTYITNLLDNGIDLKTASNMVGHADVKTTAAYDRRGEDAKSAAAEALHFPFSRPYVAPPDLPEKAKIRRRRRSETQEF